MGVFDTNYGRSTWIQDWVSRPLGIGGPNGDDSIVWQKNMTPLRFRPTTFVPLRGDPVGDHEHRAATEQELAMFSQQGRRCV
jgi:hypothetical protein